jgi:hypothetical protein
MKLSFPIDNFIKKAAADDRLFPTHLSLFMAIFFYSSDDAKAEFKVCRRELMQYSRIKSLGTYHKCMSELVAFGYITYSPSYDPIRASRISIL